MARLTTLQKTQLNNSNAAMQRASVGTMLDRIEYGGIDAPSTGSVTPMKALRYRTTPAAGTATATHAAVTLGAAAQDVTTAITNPDFPRTVTVKGNVGGIAGNVVITGTDINGAALTDTIALNGSSEVEGVKAFKTVTNINLPAKTNGSGDTVSVGRGNKIGLPVACPDAGLVIVKSFDAGAADAGTVTAGTTVATTLYAAAGTFNGTKALDLVVLVASA